MMKVSLDLIKLALPDAQFYGSWSQEKNVYLSMNSRQVSSDHCFVAIRGERFDAHDFIGDCLSKACVFYVVHEEWFQSLGSEIQGNFAVVSDSTYALGQLARAYALSHKAKRIAITGSNGKTTTKEMLKKVLSSQLHGIATKSNNNNHIGVPLSLLDIADDSDFAIIEMGTNHPGEIEYVSQFAKPHLAIITNIGDSHLEYFQTRDNVLIEKTSLQNHLCDGGLLIVNGDDPLLSQFASCKSVEIKSFGIDSGDLRPENLIWNEDMTSYFEIDGVKFQVNIPGRHNLSNALATILAARQFGLSLEQISQALREFRGMASRTEIHQINGIRLIEDCYNANPSSMEIALDTMAKMRNSGRRIVVLGDMFELGSLASQGHLQVAEFLKTLDLDLIHLVGDYSQLIERELKLQGRSGVKHWTDLSALLVALNNDLCAGDLVLFKASNGMKFQGLVKDLLEQLKNRGEL